MLQHELSALHELSSAQIETKCRYETAKFRRGEPNDPRYCLELFQRALRRSPASGVNQAPVYTDREAGEALVLVYSEFIKANINRAAIRSASIEDLVQSIWFRFWRAARNGLEFTSLEAALSYLQRTTVSALIEEQRRARNEWRQQSFDQDDQPSVDVAPHESDSELFSQHVRQRFRSRCLELLADPLEQLVFWRRYSMGYAPREIAAALARDGQRIKGRAPTARAVSDLLDQIFRRLEGDLEIRDLLSGD